MFDITLVFDYGANIQYIFSMANVFNENILYIKYALQHIFSYYSLN